MMPGKREKDDDPADEPVAAAAAAPEAPSGAVTETWTEPVADGASQDASAASEPPVDSDAVELPPAPMPEPMAPIAPAPLTTSEPAQPAAARVAHPPPVITDPAIAMGNATPADGHAADPLMDEIRVLAAERPEIVVGAAFAGGILAAMILRRLGN